MPNATYLKYSYQDVLHTTWGLAFLSNYPPQPRKLRNQVSTVFVAATSTLIHQILQMSTAERTQLAQAFCQRTPNPQHATALGLESVFFTLASDPAAAKILFAFAPLSQWLGQANSEWDDRSAGGAFIDLSNPAQGALFSRQKISAMMKGGVYHDAVVARPNTFVSSLIQLADADVINPAKADVRIVDRDRWNELQGGRAGDRLADSSETVRQAAQAGSPDSAVDSLVPAGVYSADPRTWSKGTWSKAFKALGLICAAGALLATGAGAPVGLWLLNAALFTASAAVMDWADGALSSPSLTFLNSAIPDLPEGIVLIEQTSVTGIYIDDGPDATPVQPP